jgi:nucleoside-diphosphate-sugar epimerase
MLQEPAASRHILITGAAGFIGGACTRECLRRGWRVTALVHRRTPPDLATAQIARAALEDLAALEQALLPAAPFDAIINAAGRASDVGPTAAFHAANCQSVENLITLLPRLGAPRLVHISTTDVYGLRDFVAADEATPLADRPRNPYPLSKILAERAITGRLTPRQYVILRPGVVWGPGDRTILPRLIAFLGASPVLVTFGRWRGRNRLPLAHVRNVARAACLAVACDECLGQAYNVADPAVTTFEQHCRQVMAQFLPGKRPPPALNLPWPVGWVVGALSTLLSNLARRDHPLWDPTLYSLSSTCLNLDFSTRALEDLFARHAQPFVTPDQAWADEQ